MLKLLLLFMFFLLMMKYIKKNLIQMIFQNMIFMMMFIFMIGFPLNNFNLWMNIYYILGYDFYSGLLILLSFWIFSLMLMVSEKNLFKLNYLMYLHIINIMMIFLIICFMMMNLIMFYVFFESSLILIFFLIMGWGMQIDRIQASIYMMLYTLFGSFPLFIMILNLNNINYTLMMEFIEINFLNLFIYMMLILALLMKMPMYFMHLWLPKAHVEAPLVGSMILAGVMLKLGSYGLIRILLMMSNMSIYFNKFIIIISLMGGIYSSLICLWQVDMKLLVAYSSVVHMSILMSGMMTMFNWGFIGGLMMMFAHGLCSSGLFCLVNLMYERIGSRSLMINKGMVNLFPSLSLIWFFLCSSNLSFPPSLNLFSEVMLLNSLISWNFNLMMVLIIMMFLSALYSLYLFSFSQHGLISILNYLFKTITIKDYLILMLHWIPLNLFFIMMFIYI